MAGTVTLTSGKPAPSSHSLPEGSLGLLPMLGPGRSQVWPLLGPSGPFTGTSSSPSLACLTGKQGPVEQGFGGEPQSVRPGHGGGLGFSPCSLIAHISLWFPFPHRQPVTKNTFRQYRVLGKGGFGEVSNHHFLSIQDTRQPLLPAARGRPGLAIRVPQAAPAPGDRCCWLAGLWGLCLGLV